MYYLNILALSVILYAVIFYPLLLVFFAKSFGKKRSKVTVQEPPAPTVSHIVAVFNGATSIARKIEDALASKPPAGFHELIIVTDGCSDNTALIVAADTRVRLIELKNRVGKEAALVEGIKIAEGDVIIFSDMGTRIMPGSVSAIIDNFSRRHVGVVSSIDCIATDRWSLGALFIWFEMMLRRHESHLSSCVGVSGSYFAARKHLCEKLSGHGCSDLEIAMIAVRCGYRAITDERAIGYYSDCDMLADEFERKQRTIVHGMSTVSANLDLFSASKYAWFSWQLFSHKILRWLSAICATWLLVYFSITAILSSPYFVITAIVSLSILAAVKRKAGLSNTGFFFASLAAIFGAIIALCKGNQYRTWKPSNK